VIKGILGLALAMALAGCETAPQGKPTSSAACEIFEPISWSRLDTKPTQASIREHNAAGKAACKWK
jgi:starvation-inducible outer membrane lipoprotein